jgi:pyruvate formate-lyase activating enzyme-like uncharacterized protein
MKIQKDFRPLGCTECVGGAGAGFRVYDGIPADCEYNY